MLSFKNVNVSYHSDTILKNISLDVPSGRITTIIGPNGCGKTTLISSLNKTADLTDGSIVLEGTDLSKISSKERAKLIAFLPQIRQVIPAIPVSACRTRKVSTSWIFTPQDKRRHRHCK